MRVYAISMAPMKRMTIRLSTSQRAQLKRLAQKLQIAESTVLRLAITRLAEQEGVALGQRRSA
jgi:predicted transcriptional regulator